MKILAITGVGSISPLAETADGLMAGLDAGRRGFSVLEPGDPSLPEDLPGSLPLKLPAVAGRIESFDYRPYIPPMKARRLDRGSRFAVAAARQALRRAGLEEEGAVSPELGVVLGTSSAGSGPLITFLDALIRQSPEAAPPFEFPNTVANAPASHVSIQLKLEGPNVTLAHSEAVVALALVNARLILGARRCPALVIGAVDEWNPYFQLGYQQLGALRSEIDGGGGTLLTEGCTALCVENAEEAAARGAHVLASVTGVAVGSLPGEPFRWLADAAVTERLIRQALADAGIAPAGVGSVFLAANGVEAVEDAEAEALGRVFADQSLAACGIKGALGERACVGAASLAAAALARQRGSLPPFAGGARQQWPDLLRISSAPQPLPAGATLVLLSGFGGNHAALVLD